tara:strand:- start:256 stop:570 length:315 start_codon:yes stop_codon:yes gene_type:complete
LVIRALGVAGSATAWPAGGGAGVCASVPAAAVTMAAAAKPALKIPDVGPNRFIASLPSAMIFRRPGVDSVNGGGMPVQVRKIYGPVFRNLQKSAAHPEKKDAVD